jgi:light-regulated signal transduction histidine kinase (bacteriophytochrome)
MLVEDVVDQLRAQVNGRRIEWHIEDLPVINADPVLAKIAITQLLSNAIKFTRLRDRASIRVAPIEADGLAGLSVQDNGVGFKMAHAGKLFGLFQRLHRPDEFEGNGAGLAIVQRIAHKHGGRVWAESEPDSGATFYLTLGSREGERRGGGEARTRESGAAGPRGSGKVGSRINGASDAPDSGKSQQPVDSGAEML